MNKYILMFTVLLVNKKKPDPSRDGKHVVKIDWDTVKRVADEIDDVTPL